jgi:hypothetical protein
MKFNNWSTMIEFMNFHTNAHLKAMRFTTLFRTILQGMLLENINTRVLIMVVRI